MNKISFFIAALLISSTAFAQDMADKLTLQKGDIVKVTSDINSANTQAMMGGDPMESKAIIHTYTELEIKEQLPEGYKVSQTLKKMTLDFEGFGQKMKYDSESKEKQDNPFVKQIGESVGKSEELILGFDGKVIEDEKADDPKSDSKGIMKMMGMSSSSTAESAFLLIPKDAVAKGGWETTVEKDGMKTRRKYTLGAMMGDMATVTVQSQTKGDVAMNRGGMAMTTKVNTLTEEEIMVNTKTGRVQMQHVNMTNNSKTIMNDTESPSTGKTTVNTTFE